MFTLLGFTSEDVYIF